MVKSTQTGPRFRFMRCTLNNFRPCLFYLAYNHRNARLGVDWLLPILHKDDVWSDRRKLLDRSLRPAQAASTSYRKIMEEKTRTFLSQLFVTPNDFRSHIGLSVFNHSKNFRTEFGDRLVFKGILSCPSHTGTN